MMKTAFVSILSLAIGAGAGWALHSADSTAEPGVASIGLAAASPFGQQGVPAAVDVAQLRAMMREELTNALAMEHGNEQSATTVVRTPIPASSEAVAQRNEAVQEIDAMINGGQWGNEERYTFHQKLALLDSEQAERVLQKVVIGLNEGTIQPTTDGPAL